MKIVWSLLHVKTDGSRNIVVELYRKRWGKKWTISNKLAQLSEPVTYFIDDSTLLVHYMTSPIDCEHGHIGEIRGQNPIQLLPL